MNHCCWSVDQKANVIVAGIDVVAAAVDAADVKVTQTMSQMVVLLNCSKLWN